MKEILIIILFFTVSFSLAQPNPQKKEITNRFFADHEVVDDITPALQKRKGFTNYDELINFLKNIEKNHSNLVKIDLIGKSQNGYDIPIIYINNPNSAYDKVKVWMQGGLHGNEPASTEGVLYLIHKVLNDDQYKYLLEKIELAIIPMANIDGYLKQRRNAADNLDLNRDQTKLMAPESVILKKAFSDFQPEIALDFHEYNPFRKDFYKLSSFGVMNAYDCMFLYSNNLNVPINIRTVTDTLFVENARRAMAKNGLRYHDYFSTSNNLGVIQFNLGSTNARSSATSYSLSNTFATLIEVRGVNLGRTSFKRRINTTFLVGISYLETAFNNITLIKDILSNPVRELQEIVINSEPEIYKDTISFIDLDIRQLIDLEVTIRDARKSKLKLSRSIPDYYYLMQEQSSLVEKMNILGLKLTN